METIKVRGEFHAGHRLLGYDGKCAVVHGHTWRGGFVVRTERFPRDERLDISVDFGVLKGIFKSLDHKMMVSGDDEVFLNSELFASAGVVVIPGKNPTVENVAHYCVNEAAQLLERLFPGLEYSIEVTIQETDNNIFTLERTLPTKSD